MESKEYLLMTNGCTLRKTSSCEVLALKLESKSICYALRFSKAAFTTIVPSSLSGIASTTFEHFSPAFNSVLFTGRDLQ